MKKNIRYISIMMIIVILLTSCKSDMMGSSKESIDEDEEKIKEEIVEDGKIVLPITLFNTLNPLRTDNSYYYMFSKLIFESLFEFNDELEIVPKLAESYNINTEGNIINIRLRDDVYWHDGNKLTSADVGFTIDTIKHFDREGSYGQVIHDYLGNMGNININNAVNYNIIDDYNIDIIFDKTYNNGLEILTFPIISASKFNIGNTVDNYNAAGMIENYEPVGTGPYKFIEYEKLKNIYLEKNIDYWNGEPQIKTIVGKVLDDEDLVVTAFETGQLSIAPSTGVDWDKYKSNDRIKILEYISPSYEFLGFNFNNPKFQGEEGHKIRQAIAYAIDRQGIIKEVYLGHGTMTDVPIHPDSYLLSKETISYGYNIEESKQILKDLGYVEKNQDGYLMDENNRILSFRLTTNSFNPYRLRAAEIIEKNLKTLGIEIIVDYPVENISNIDKSLEDEQWENFNQKINSGNYDIALMGWDTSPIVDPSYMFHSSKIGDSNFIRYGNAELDELFLELSNTIDRDRKKELYSQIQNVIVEELPYISLYYRNRGFLMDEKIRGDLNPNYFNMYKGIEDAYLVEKIEKK